MPCVKGMTPYKLKGTARIFYLLHWCNLTTHVMNNLS